jgi:hypothetical protein
MSNTYSDEQLFSFLTGKFLLNIHYFYQHTHYNIITIKRGWNSINRARNPKRKRQ